MDGLIILTMGFVCCACFLMGATVGQKASKGEEIQTPTVNPIKAHREREARKEAQMEQNRIDTILQNIEKYDGTGRGQEDVPGR